MMKYTPDRPLASLYREFRTSNDCKQCMYTHKNIGYIAASVYLPEMI